MGFVESFSHAMIEAFLDEDGLHYLRDRDGDFIVQFGYDEEIQGHPRFLLAVSGDDQEQYCLRGDTLQRVPRSDWDRMLRLCNEWNALYKMPKVYLEVDDPNASTTGRVVCEQWIDLEVGRPPGAGQPPDRHVLLRLLRILALARPPERPFPLGDPDESSPRRTSPTR